MCVYPPLFIYRENANIFNGLMGLQRGFSNLWWWGFSWGYARRPFIHSKFSARILNIHCQYHLILISIGSSIFHALFYSVLTLRRKGWSGSNQLSSSKCASFESSCCSWMYAFKSYALLLMILKKFYWNLFQFSFSNHEISQFFTNTKNSKQFEKNRKLVIKILPRIS